MIKKGKERFEKNPFLSGAEVATKTRRVTNKRGDMMLVNSNTGEIQTQIAGFWEAEEVDSTKFVKLFIRGVNIGKDRVLMSFAEVDQALTPMSESTFMRGMRELVEKKFIAATPTLGVYWLNPDFVWNGDRLAFVKEYRKKQLEPQRDTKTIDMFR